MQIATSFRDGLEFERRMRDFRTAQQLLQGVLHLLHPGKAVEHDMGRKSVLSRTDGPDVDLSLIHI